MHTVEPLLLRVELEGGERDRGDRWTGRGRTRVARDRVHSESGYPYIAGYIWLYLVISGYIWLRTVISGYTYLDISGCIWLYLVTSMHIQV